MIRILGKNQRVGIIKQPKTIASATAFECNGATTLGWTNPAVAGTNFRTIYPDAMTTIPDSAPNHEYYNTTSQYGALFESERFHADNTTGLKRFAFSGTLWKNDAAPLIIGAAQAVAEAGTTPFSKSITSGFIAGLLDFANDDGHLHSLAFDTATATAADGFLMVNGVVDRIELIWDFNAQGVARNLKYNVEWVFSAITPDTNLSGTWATTTRAPFNDDDTFAFSTLTSDSVDLTSITPRRFTFSINNNVSVKSQTTAGVPNNFDMRPQYMSNLLFDFGATNSTVPGDFKAGATVAATLTNDITLGLDGYFALALPGGVMTRNPYQYEGDFAALSMDIEWQSTGGATPFTLTLVDTQDWNY